MIVVKLPKGFHPDGGVNWEKWYFPYSAGASILQYIPKELKDAPLSRIVCSGRSIPTKPNIDFNPVDRELLKKYLPRDNDELILIPAISDPYTGVMIGSIFLSWAFIAQVAVAVALTALSMLLTRLLAPTPPRTKQGGSYTSPTSYGWSGIQNTYGPGNPIPVIFGFHKAGIQVAYWVLRQETMAKTQTYMEVYTRQVRAKMIGIFGRGPIEAITNIKINNNPIENFADLAYTTKLGDPAQTAIPGFNEQGVTYEANAKITTTPYIYTTTGNTLTAIELSFQSPQGLGKLDEESGDMIPYFLIFNVQYAVHNEGTHPNEAYTDLGNHVIWGKSSSAIGWAKRIDELEPGQYDIKLTLVSGGAADGEKCFGEIYLGQVSEFTEDSPETYNGLAYIAIDALATDQLSDQPFTVTADILGIKLPVWDGADWTGEVWSDNPAAHCREIMCNNIWGFAPWCGTAQVDDDALGVFWDYCNECNLLKWSENFSDEVWVKNPAAVTTNSTIAPNGEWTADTLTAITSDFTMLQSYTGLEIERTFSIYLKRKTGTGNIQITQDGGSTWTTVIITSSAWTRVTLTATVASPSVGVRIVTNGDAVYMWGAMLNIGDTAVAYLRSGAVDSVPRHTNNLVWNQRKPMPDILDDILSACRGKRFRIGGKWRIVARRSKDATQLFNSGNVVGARVEYVDDTLNFETLQVSYMSADKGYTPSPFEVSLGFEVKKVKNMSIYGPTNIEEAFRDASFDLNLAYYIHELLTLKVSVDAINCFPGECIYYAHEVPGIGIANGRVRADSVALDTIQLDESVTIEAGKTYQIMIRFSGGANPDLVETQSVNNAPGVTDTLTVSSDFSQLPKQYDLYSFGETDSVVKKYWIDDFERDEDQYITMKCSEENENVYNDWLTAPYHEPVEFPNRDGLPPQIRTMNVKEITKLNEDGLWSTNLLLHWPVPDFKVNKGIFRGVQLDYDIPATNGDVATFESGETWTGGAADTTWPEYREKEGTRSRKITPTTDGWEYSERTVSLDYSAAAIDGFAIWVYLKETYDCYIGSCIQLIMETDGSNYFMVEVASTNLHHGWNLIYKTKADYYAGRAGSPSWATITKLKVGFKRSAGRSGAFCVFDTWRYLGIPLWVKLGEGFADFYWPNAPQNRFIIFRGYAVSTVGVVNKVNPAYAGIFTKGKVDLPIDIAFIPSKCNFDTVPYVEWASKAKAALQYDASPAGYVDETTEAGNTTVNDMNLFLASPAQGDRYLFCAPAPFKKMALNIGQAGVGTWTVTWKWYKNVADGWTALSGVSDGTSGFKTAGLNVVTWTEPTTWKKITINGVQGWWICAEITAFTSKTTLPLGTQAWLYAVDKDFNNYEIRFDTEFGVKSENQIYTPAEGHTWKWEKFIEWAAARGLTEGEQRSITIYIKARDSYKNYSENYGSIVLINTAPDMSATTITAKAVIHNNRRDVIIGWSAYIEPSDITKYTVYGSPTNPCPLVAGNIKAIVGKGVDSVIVKGLPYVRGVSWDWRVRPSDIYGDGTASD